MFLDIGSQRSFISSWLARKLKLPVIKCVALNIAQFGSQVVKGKFDVVACRIHLGERVVPTKLVVHDNVNTPIHNIGPANLKNHLQEKGWEMAVVEIKGDVLKNVNLLIGADYFNYFVIGMDKIDGVSVFVTHNGIMPFGRVPQWALQGVNIAKVCTLRICRIVEPDPGKDVWWRLDMIGIVPHEHFMISERVAIDKVTESIQKIEQGCQVNLPFCRSDRPGNNYNIALTQLHLLERHFAKDESYCRDYEKVLQTYLEAAFIEEAQSTKVEGLLSPPFWH
ncbi:uncharacterized protein [Macrobrachium rosenbergii]|uniref:uncharacterized protein n=1 Tax=Macrobrachium rosenbergii TaxID=79674 RepID=UPI0034D4DA9C